ncbi:MAG: DUF47 family protein [Deltaproteobacteria bacterium]|nr:DUF47 family protein [Deltaproteobacteria bacterium]
MFSLQEFLGKDPRFYDLLEGTAREAYNCAEALKKIVATSAESADLHLVRQARANSKRMTEELSELAVKTFVTVLDREDIETLASAIYRIPKPLEKFAERYVLLREIFQSTNTFHQLDLIEDGTQTVLLMVKSLRRGINSELVARLNAKLQNIEARADNLEMDLLRDLYRKVSNPAEIVATRDLFDLLEKAIDRCRDAGNHVLHICHKNS